MQRKRKLGLIATLIAVLAVSAVAANTFYFIWIETPFEPNNYHWSESWEVKEMVDFLDAQLTITGCAYQGQPHDVELIITNVATIADYYALSFAYTVNWWIDETHNEVIIQGLYDGALGIGETFTDTTVFQPSIIGIGEVKMDIIDIVWAISKPITWTTEIVDETGIMGAGNFEVTEFTVTGASMSNSEPGVVSITIQNYHYPTERGISFNVEIVELSQTVGAEVDGRLPETYTDFTYNFAALANGGAYTMRLTITDWI
jgi:hypothetical protein